MNKKNWLWNKFLYIVPLKQGLKQALKNYEEYVKDMFLYIVPLKQGLKQLLSALLGVW